MSQDQEPSGPTEQPGRRRHPVLAILMGLTGLILLVPGLCVSIAMVYGGGAWEMWVFGFAITAAGIALLVRARG